MYSSDEKVLIGFVKNKIEDLGTRRGAYMFLIIFELLLCNVCKKIFCIISMQVFYLSFG